MKVLNIEKVEALPSTIVPNTLYAVKSALGSSIDIYLSDKTGTNAYGMVVAPKVALFGPGTVGTNETVEYTITNYDEFTSYTVNNGTALASSVVDGNKITATITNTSGSKSFSVNGNIFTLAITTPFIRKPVVSLYNSKVVNTELSLKFTTSDFLSTSPTTHISTDWEISTDSTFTTIVFSSYIDTENLLSWLITDLTPNTTYYVRARHKNGIYGYSEWSKGVKFATGTNTPIKYLGEKIFPHDAIPTDRFGHSVDITPDGTRMVIGVIDDEPGEVLANYGAVYVYVEVAGYWHLETKILAPDRKENDNFGSSVGISDKGNVIVIGANNADYSGMVNRGSVYVYKRVGRGWLLDAQIQPTGSANDNLGEAVCISNNGKVIACSAPNRNNGGNLGSVYVYIDAGSGVWNQDTTFTSPLSMALKSYGMSLSMNKDGSILAVGSNLDNNKGSVYVYTKSGTWGSPVQVNSSDLTTNDNYGYSVKLSYNGKRLVVGAPNKTVASVPNAGSLYVFNFTTSWAQEIKHTNSTPVNNELFGYSVSGNLSLSKVCSGAINSLNIATGLTNVGTAYVYFKTAGSWSLESAIVPSGDLLGGDNFGYSVALSSVNQKLIVGSPKGPGVAASGSVYTYLVS